MSDRIDGLRGSPPLLAGDALGFDADGRPHLRAGECRDCGARVFPPPTGPCPECLSENVAALVLAAEGRLYSWSRVHVAPGGWRVPYVAGYVDLPEGVRVFAHVVDAEPDRLEIDMAVTLTVAELGTAPDGSPISSYAFAPAG